MTNQIPALEPGLLKRHNEEEFPVTQHHSVLVLNPNRKLYHVLVDPDSGELTERPELLELEDPSYRKVFGLAGEALTAEGKPAFASHAAFSILPIRSEPNAAFADCYLVNALRLKPVNIWTAAELNDHPDIQAQALDRPPVLGRVLLASAQGEIFDVTLTADGGANPTATAQLLGPAQLRNNPELWRMLRNGCVVGHASLSGEPVLVPLVNLASFAQPEPVSAGEGEVPLENSQHAGTFDFKWQANRVIRVALLPPTLSAAEGINAQVAGKALTLVKELAETWTLGTSLKFDFLEVTREGDQGPPRIPSDYDLLVDLDPLPRTLPALFHQRKEIRGEITISFTMSELGTYATRRPLNEPTMYIGLPRGLKNGNGNAFGTSREYFESDAFKYVILHEFGHALGLPHLHQHPDLKQNAVFKPPQEVRNLIAQHLGLEMDVKFIMEHLMLSWPGSKEYSDFVPVTGKSPETLASESVMMGLPIQAILRGVNTTQLKFHDKLGTLDRQWILQMYPKPAPA